MRLELRSHPDTPPDNSQMAVEAWLERWPDGRAELSYHVHADVSGILLARAPASGRADELWKTTCFELFLKRDAGYQEFNFAPSGAWAAYGFNGYRSGMAPLELEHAPEIDMEDLGHSFVLDVVVDLEGMGRFGLSAVIEETSGTKSYWALAHPPGPPDFHHETCFAATLPPIEQA